ncbi:MAG: hypothetical protein J6R81_03710 [Alistipes sp.]|nr:hypothetical protein [Alistipes sp.]
MMKSNISNALSAIMTHTAEELRSKEINVAYKDYLVAAILDNDATMAYNTLATLMQEWQIRSLATAIRRDAEVSAIREIVSPKCYYDALCNFLEHSIAPRRVSTVHILYAAATDRTSATHNLLHGYGINSEDILCAVARLIGNTEHDRHEIECSACRCA